MVPRPHKGQFRKIHFHGQHSSVEERHQLMRDLALVLGT